ncbi:carboxylate--amine ligase [Thermodesulfobacteriota bacterium]
MAVIYIGGAGGAPSNNFIRSLRDSSRNDFLIGASCVASDLFLADTDKKHLVPRADALDYPEKLLNLLKKIKPDLLHVQNDLEVLAVSRLRDQIRDLGVRIYMPDQEAVEICADKGRSAEIWEKSGVKIPRTIRLNSPHDLKKAFERLGSKIWIRATTGAAGRGALPTKSYAFSKTWIDHFNGWEKFLAAELLTSKTITWLSIWYQGELVVAQTRRRHSWCFGDRALSGVTGITGVAETCSDEIVDKIAQDAIFSITSFPNGIFGVDMTYDHEGWPNVTEINIGRFFTTHYFFTKAGLNMPEIYCDIALEGKFPSLKKRINPLPDGMVWIRGMDTEPVLTTIKELEKMGDQHL